MPKRVIPVVVNVPPPCPVNLLRSGSWKIIVELVAVKHGVTFEAIIGPRREAHLTEARHEAIYLVHLHCPHLSYPRMGEHFDRDHTSILHAVRKMAARKLSTLSTSVHNLAEDRLDPIESRPDKGGKPNASVRYAGYPQ